MDLQGICAVESLPFSEIFVLMDVAYIIVYS